MSKTTASIPRSRSKYLIQFLKRKIETSPENPKFTQDQSITVYNNITDLPHRRGNSAINTGEYTIKEENNYIENPIYEEEKDKIYQTPKSSSTRRRIKKINSHVTTKKYMHNYESSEIKLGIESTNYTKEGTQEPQSKFQRKRD